MLYVTTSQKGAAAFDQEALRIGQLLESPVIDRNDASLLEVFTETQADKLLVVGSKGPVLYTSPKAKHQFHISMAQLRLLALKRGQRDHLLEAVGSIKLTSFLDCTAGLCSDSLVVSYAHPTCQRLYAVEGLAALAYISNWGCRHFRHEDEKVTAALRRIQVVAMYYEDLLPRLGNNSFDVVYLDPMFEVPVMASSQFLSLRGQLVETVISRPMIKEALRVAKYRVIIKERPHSHLFKTYRPTQLVGGKYSRIAYGIYEKG